MVVLDYLKSALWWLDHAVENHPDDTQARVWRDHLAEDYKSLALHAQKQEVV